MPNESDAAKCEWPGCHRPATRMRAWGDTLVCEGHDMLMDANYDTYGEFGISAEEYHERLLAVKAWLKANP